MRLHRPEEARRLQSSLDDGVAGWPASYLQVDLDRAVVRLGVRRWPPATTSTSSGGNTLRWLAVIMVQRLQAKTPCWQAVRVPFVSCAKLQVT